MNRRNFISKLLNTFVLAPIATLFIAKSHNSKPQPSYIGGVLENRHPDFKEITAEQYKNYLNLVLGCNFSKAKLI